MLVIGAFNMGLILLETPTAILAASAIGYVCANGISLFAYVKAKQDPELAALPRSFWAPSGWKHVALFFGLFNLPLCLAGIIYLNATESSWSATGVGMAVLAAYLPLWLYSQREAERND